MVRAVFAQMGYEVAYDEVSWRQHQLDVKNGARDIAAGAFKNPERAEYTYFSAPYRKETDVLYVRKGEASRYRFKNVGELLARFHNQNFRLGMIDGFYYGPDIMRFINDPANASRLVGVPDDVANFENLLNHRIDGFIVDRLVGATLAWRYGWQLAVEEASPPPRFSTRWGWQPLPSSVSWSPSSRGPILSDCGGRCWRRLAERAAASSATSFTPTPTIPF